MVTAIRNKRRQRGASVLVVMLVCTTLVGIGMFAARSAILSTKLSGSGRRLSQAGHFSQYALSTGTAAIALDAQKYVNQMPKYVYTPGDPKCWRVQNVPNATCASLHSQLLEIEMGAPLVLPADLPNNMPGGLGFSGIKPDFNIDITELAPAAPPVPGEALNRDSPVKLGYLSVKLTATGRLVPPSSSDSIASVQTWRAHLTVGPLPNPAPRPYSP